MTEYRLDLTKAYMHSGLVQHVLIPEIPAVIDGVVDAKFTQNISLAPSGSGRQVIQNLSSVQRLTMVMMRVGGSTPLMVTTTAPTAIPSTTVGCCGMRT